ncbi:ankyrin repeat domain-containing protein [Vibrio campbellii]|uniref:ankyrin repeat domain-containing protein n=1 Tax=Vibrio campbellii TaxID=680 RepID=UPI002108A363|nr:ankyrin repeat domain-containing protein [Vibrio campbellii]UTZ23597.1 ankyrin repeat domain-containing protein [Vibrio campbellii]
MESLELGADPNFISNDQYTFLNLLSDINGRYYGVDVESNNALRTKLAKNLIQHGADVNLTTEGKPPLYFALGSSNTELVKLLLAHTELDLNHQDREGNTAIMKFFKYHDKNTFEEQSQLLFQRRSDINWQQKNYQGNNLHDILNQIVTKYNQEEMKIWIEESLRVNTSS